MEDSSTVAGGPNLPPGFRFHPTDEELVVHYLKKKAQSDPLPVSIIADIDLYKFDPWELPAKATFGEQEWYFFSPRDRKYPNGARPNRAATSGYWKATGTDKPVLTSGGTHKIGVKKALVFYGGKPPKGVKTNWIMHEYRLTGNKPRGYDPTINRRGTSLRLDDWVLCRIYKKSEKRIADDRHEDEELLASRLVGRSSVAASTYAIPSASNHHAHNLFDKMLEPINVEKSGHLSDLCSPISPKQTVPMAPPLMFSNGANSNAMAGIQLPLGETHPFLAGLNWY